MKAIDRRLRALEATSAHRQHVAKDSPAWLSAAQEDGAIWGLLHTVALYDNGGEYRGYYSLPIRSEVDAARAALDRRFGGESERVVTEYCAIWREIQDEC